MVRVICVIDVVCLRSNFHVVRAGDVNAFFWGPHGVIFSLGRWRACQARSSLQNPCWGIQDCGWPGKKSPFLTSCTAFFLCPSPCSDSAQQIIVIQALMKSIIALVRYLLIFFIIGFCRPLSSLFLLSLTHYRRNMSLVCECLQLWLHCCVSLKREKSSMTLMPSRLVCTFSIPGAWKYFQSWKIRKTLSSFATIVQGD